MYDLFFIYLFYHLRIISDGNKKRGFKLLQIKIFDFFIDLANFNREIALEILVVGF